MLKKLACVLILGLVFLHFHSKSLELKPEPIVPNPVPVNPVIKVITRQEAVDKIKTEDVKEYVRVLSSKEFNGRGTGEEGNRLAAKYICDHLQKHNIKVVKQSFKVNRGNGETENIIGIIEPKIKNTKNIIVIGAHFDHLGGNGSTYYPGADDNASGTAGLMAIAEALSAYRESIKSTILVQFYSAEEIGLVGSAYYCNNPLFPIDNHVAMINLDMVGYLKKYTDNEFTIVESEKGKDNDIMSCITAFEKAASIKSIVKDLSSKYPFGSNISSYRPGGSDHAPFYRKNIPVVFLHTGTHPYYHKPSDTPEKLNYEGLAEISKLGLEIAIEVDNNYSDGITRASSR